MPLSCGNAGNLDCEIGLTTRPTYAIIITGATRRRGNESEVALCL